MWPCRPTSPPSRSPLPHALVSQDLTALVELSLLENPLAHLPTAVGRLPRLRSLRVSPSFQLQIPPPAVVAQGLQLRYLASLEQARARAPRLQRVMNVRAAPRVRAYTQTHSPREGARPRSSGAGLRHPGYAHSAPKSAAIGCARPASLECAPPAPGKEGTEVGPGGAMGVEGEMPSLPAGAASKACASRACAPRLAHRPPPRPRQAAQRRHLDLSGFALPAVPRELGHGWDEHPELHAVETVDFSRRAPRRERAGRPASLAEAADLARRGRGGRGRGRLQPARF